MLRRTHRRMRQRSARGGFFLPAALLVLAGLAALISVSVTRSLAEVSSSEISSTSQQAFHVAEAGVDAASLYLRQLPAPPNSRTSFNPFGGPRTIGIGSYNVVVTPSTENTTTFLDDFNITVTAAARGIAVKRELTCVLQMESFSRFAYFADKHLTLDDDEDDGRAQLAWWTDGMTTDGPVHLNDRLNIRGSPVFNGLVSSTERSIRYHRGPEHNQPQFNGGLELGAKEIRLPSTLEPLSTRGRLFEGTTTVQVSGSSLFITNDGVTQLFDVSKPVFVKEGDLLLDGGTVQGQLTLGSDKNIVIRGSLTYACNPEETYDLDCPDPYDPAKSSKDLLGLVAKKHVIVDVAEPGDLTLQASIMAVRGSFKVANYRDGPPKGTLRIFGGLIQRRAGLTGVVNAAGELVSGYQAQYAYDRRLLAMAPPLFPNTGRYKEVMWIDTAAPVFTPTGDAGSDGGTLWDEGGMFDPGVMDYPGGYSEPPPGYSYDPGGGGGGATPEGP